MRDSRRHRRAGDGWTTCSQGHDHWGLEGAAGLLVVDPARRSEGGDRVLLQHRALWSHHGGLWALAGGARDLGESALDAALREAGEEAGVPRDGLRVRQSWFEDHGSWSYTTVVADAVEPFAAQATDPESIEVRWVPVDQVRDYPLLPAFAAMWERMHPVLRSELVVVVDAANVVGSRPDGWWKDRAGAAERLRDELAALLVGGIPAETVGLSGHSWWPRLVMVTEGAARGVTSTGDVEVVPASGEGDDTIVDVVAHLTGEPAATVVVATADRGLSTRVAEAGARVIGPRALLDLTSAARDGS